MSTRMAPVHLHDAEFEACRMAVSSCAPLK